MFLKLIPSLLVVQCLGCGFAAPTKVRFVLPDAFRGAFIVVEAKDARLPTQQDGVTTIDVSESRIVRVSSAEVLKEMHTEEAHFKDGTSLLIGPHAGPDVPPDRIALRSVGSGGYDDNPPSWRYFVGTEDEAFDYDFSELERSAFSTQ